MNNRDVLDFDQHLLKFCRDSGLPKNQIIASLETTKFFILWSDAEEAKRMILRQEGVRK